MSALFGPVVIGRLRHDASLIRRRSLPTSTYRYTAYGQPDKTGTTGDDIIQDDPAKDADTVNP